MTAVLSQPASRFFDLLREGQPITVQTARDHGITSPVAAAREILLAGHQVRCGVTGTKCTLAWSIPKHAKRQPPRPCGVKRSEAVAIREAKIEALMADGKWRTLHEIVGGIGGASSNVRVRDSLACFRARPDVFEFERRPCVDKLSGHWEYRMVRRAGK